MDLHNFFNKEADSALGSLLTKVDLPKKPLPSPIPSVVNSKDLISFDDYDAVRDAYHRNILNAFTHTKPIANARFSLAIEDPTLELPKDTSLKRQRYLKLHKQSLESKIKGRYVVRDVATGKIVKQSRPRTLMNLPYLTNRGTFLRNGTEFAILKQFRLLPNVYVRNTADGNTEAQFNVKQGTGVNFRVLLDPNTSLLTVKWGGKRVPLYPLLKDMGVDDKDISNSWGKAIFDLNKNNRVSSHYRPWVNSISDFGKTIRSNNSLFKIGKSKIHGEGSFASSYIPEGSVIGPSVLNHSDIPNAPVYIKTDLAKYTNHSNVPNTTIKETSPGVFSQVALKDIRRDDEYTVDYHKLPFDNPTEFMQKTSSNFTEAPKEFSKNIKAYFRHMVLDPKGTQATIDAPHAFITPSTFLDASRKVLKVYNKEADPSNRDSLQFQTVHDYGDFIAHKISLDQDNVLKSALWKVTGDQGHVGKIPIALFDKHVKNLFNKSGMSQNIDQINPADTHGQSQRVVRLGEGGIPTIDSAPKEAREVQPSYAGFVDPVRTPESLRIGLDNFFAAGVKKGPNNLLYKQFINPKTGAKEWVDMHTASASVISFPDIKEEYKGKKFIPALYRSQGTSLVPRDQVDYQIPDGDSLFSIGAQVVPFKSGVKGMRLLMGSKYPGHSLPLVNREAPLVQNLMPDSKDSYYDYLSKHSGVVRSNALGQVTKVTNDFITVKDRNGEEHTQELYNNFSLGHKTFMHNIPQVKVGDMVKNNQVLASSNYTTNKGIFAPGVNFRVAYMPYKGLNYEDAFVISKGAADKLSSTAMYGLERKINQGEDYSKVKFTNKYPTVFSKKQLSHIDDNGRVKVGTTLTKGDPMLLGVATSIPSLSNLNRRINTNISKTWEHDFPGVVTDVADNKEGTNVKVRAINPMKVGDKLALPFGAKGVISAIIPDEDMIKDENDKPVELILNANGLISRTNFGQIIAASLGKIAAKTGTPYKLPGFMKEDLVDYTKNELAKHNVKTNETVYDPTTNKKIPGIFVGNTYTLKLQQTAESKGKSRGISTYSQDGVPGRGGAEGSKHLGCFLYDQPIETHIGDVPIGNIVNNKLPLKVWSYNFLRDQWLYNSITNWFPNRAKSKDVLKITLNTLDPITNKHVVITPTINHKMYTYEGDEILAGDLQENTYLYSYNLKPTKDQIAVIYSFLLSNGSIKGKYFHQDNSPLSYYKQSILKSLASVSADNTLHGEDNYIEYLYDKEDIKDPSLPWLQNINKFGIALWLVETLSLRLLNKADNIYKGNIPTNINSPQSIHILRDFIATYLDTHVMITKMENSYRLELDIPACKAALDLIAFHIPYTVMPKGYIQDYAHTFQKNINIVNSNKENNLGRYPVKILSIEKYFPEATDDDYIDVYDIEVENAHTYMAGPLLVSNSMELDALLAHNVPNVIKDFKIIKGRQNDDFWRQIKLGKVPAMPSTPFVYDKFRALIRASGVNLHEGDSSDNIFAMTDKQLRTLTGNNRLDNAKTFTANTMQPIAGGLFDPSKTNSNTSGDRFSYFELPEPLLNPLMEEPVRSLLGLTSKDFIKEVTGANGIPKGSNAGLELKKKLQALDLNAIKRKATDTIKNGTPSKKDTAIKQLGYIEAMKKHDITPEEFMWSRVPVIPPKFRAITKQGDMLMVSDMNAMYKALFDTITDLNDTKGLPEPLQQQARINVYNALKATIGLQDPAQPTLKVKGIGGVLKHLIGKNSPKIGFFQTKVLGLNSDMTGLGVASPDPTIKLNQVGLPEQKAWGLYEPFVIRDLVQKGYPAIVAAKAVKEQTPEALNSLKDVVKQRPVILNRAPTLHKFSMIALEPILHKDNVIKTNPAIVGPLGLDYDGDSSLILTSIVVKYGELETFFIKTRKNICIVDNVGVCYSHNNKKGDIQMYDKNTKVATTGMDIRISDIPYIKGTEEVSANGKITTWDVPEGIYMHTLDRQTYKQASLPITKFSEHRDVPMYDVTLGSKFSSVITCSQENSLIIYKEGSLVVSNPEDAMGYVVPKLKSLLTTNSCDNFTKDIRIGNRVPAGYELGVFLGSMLGDGWVDNHNQVRLSSDYPELRNTLIAYANNPKVNLPLKEPADSRQFTTNRWGSSLINRINFHLSKAGAHDLRNLIGAGAENKVIPWQSLKGSKAHLTGLLVGLLSTDGAINYGLPAKGKTTSSKNVAYDTISPYLRDSFKVLCMKLGIKCSVFSYTGSNSTATCYKLSLSLIDVANFYRNNKKFRLINKDKQEALEKIVADIDPNTQKVTSADQVPCPSHLSCELSWLGFSKITLSSECVRYKKNNCMPRTLALKLVKIAHNADWSVYKDPSYLKKSVRTNRTPKEAELAVLEWCQLVLNDNITWVRVEDAKFIGNRTCYDVTIPGPLTFASSEGIIVQDTVSYSVPISAAAVKEAREKMTPQRNLLGVRYGTPHYVPTQEYTHGIHAATKEPTKVMPKVYATKEDALRAYNRGEIDVNTPVKIVS